MTEPKYFDRRSASFREWFEKGLTYEAHVATAKEAHQARWHEAHEQLRLTEAQRGLLGKFTRRMQVPVAVVLSEDFFECERFGDRTLAAYRGMAERQLGPACPIGPASADATEAEATIQEWVERFERVQLMLRLSPMLRERHGD